MVVDDEHANLAAVASIVVCRLHLSESPFKPHDPEP